MWIQGIGLGDRCLYSTSHLTGPCQTPREDRVIGSCVCCDGERNKQHVAPVKNDLSNQHLNSCMHSGYREQRMVPCLLVLSRSRYSGKKDSSSWVNGHAIN